MDFHVGDQRRISVAAFVGHARNASAFRDIARGGPRRRPRLPICCFRRGLHHTDQAPFLQMLQAELTGSTPACTLSSSMKHSFANVFWIRKGERNGPVKNGGAYRVCQHAITAHHTTTFALASSAGQSCIRELCCCHCEAPRAGSVAPPGFNGSAS